MKNLRIGIIQQHNSADISDNMTRLKQSIEKLAKQHAQLVILQELHNSLYFCQTEDVDNFTLSETIPGRSTDFYSAIAKENNVVLVISLFEKQAAGLYFNTAVVIESDGTIAGKYRKMHIPDDPSYYEKFYFTPGDLGFHPIKTSVGMLGIQVCWDQWFPEGARLMALAGADILIYPTAIGYSSIDKVEEQQRQRDAWMIIQRGNAIANGLHVVAVNRVGIEPDIQNGTSGITFWGSSFVAGPQGELLYEAPEKEEAVDIIDIDIDRNEQVRQWWPFFRDRRIDEYSDLYRRFREEK